MAHEIGWIIVDSAAPACGGAAEEPAPALSFFAALDEIGLPNLVIAHITKAGTNDAPYGSVFWKNEARRNWFVSSDDTDPNNLKISLFGRKTNDGPKLRDIAIRITFDGGHGPISFAADRVDSPEVVAHTSTQNRVWDALRQPKTVKELAEELHLSESTIKNNLARGPFEKEGKAGSTGGKEPNIWGRRARE